ncbi:MAG: hypothetical protein WC505_01895 [Patescibacteria group bacterium]
MIAIKNLEKYFTDHPELADRRDAVLSAAREKIETGCGDVITGGAAQEILGDLAPAFFREVENDPTHQEIGVNALRELNKS